MKKRPEPTDIFRLDTAPGPWASVGVGMVPVGGFGLRRDLRRLDLATGSVDADEEEWLTTEADQGQRYEISVEPDIVSKPSMARQFERLGEDPSPDRILEFANRYGFLEAPVSLVEVARSPIPGQMPVGDLILGERVSAWQWEALMFRELRSTWQNVLDMTEGGPQHQRAAHAYLAKRIHWAISGAVSYQSTVTTPKRPFPISPWLAAPHDLTEGDLQGRFSHGDLVGPARLHVHREVNKQLRGHVSPAVPAFLTDPAMRLFPDSLLAAIYLRFALDLVSPSARESICNYCHLPFAQRRRNHVYCDKRCKENARYHRGSKAQVAGEVT